MERAGGDASLTGVDGGVNMRARGDFRVDEQEQHQVATTLIREHVNGWIAQIEAGEVVGKWHVAAYPTERDEPWIPVHGYVSGQAVAMQLADSLVQDHAAHPCSDCGPWRRSDEQRLPTADRGSLSSVNP